MEKERYWTFIAYPESLPDNWKDILQETGLQIGISPLHNKDLNADGEIKKAHYHILLCFNGPTTYSRVEKITKELNASIPKRVISAIGIIRYFTHKDNPEKAQYNEEEIQSLNGFDIKDFDGLTLSAKEELKRSIVKLIRALKIKEYQELVDYTLDNDFRDMFEVVSNNTYFFNNYLKSYKYNDTMELANNYVIKK